MANTPWSPSREGFLQAGIAWTVPTIKASCVRGYVFNAAHQFVSDVTTAGGVLVSTFTLTGKTATDGVADAADGTWLAVPAGAAVDVVIIYQASAVGGGADVAATAQRLILFIDNASNLPFTPIGIDVACRWSDGATRIFQI